ncbi:MAG: hypothetical protein HYS13_07780 [Planctomycetia bacterium]|nr:hypothetical protein [Planctomycetia bacterium]
MIYDEWDDAEVSLAGDQLVIREISPMPMVVARVLTALVPLLAGATVLGVFFSGGFPKPAQTGLAALPAWSLVSAFVVALGVVPLLWGISLIVLRRRYVLRPADSLVECWWLCFSLPLFARRRGLAGMEEVLVRYDRGWFAARWRYFISCCGPRGAIQLVASNDHDRAQSMAQQIADCTGLPVRFEDASAP